MQKSGEKPSLVMSSPLKRRANPSIILLNLRINTSLPYHNNKRFSRVMTRTRKEADDRFDVKPDMSAAQLLKSCFDIDRSSRDRRGLLPSGYGICLMESIPNRRGIHAGNHY